MKNDVVSWYLFIKTLGGSRIEGTRELSSKNCKSVNGKVNNELERHF